MHCDPYYGKASTTNVLDSASHNLIVNCLNTALFLYVDSISSKLGTVASIAGLDISKINTTSRTTLNFNAGTNWTRVFTQVKGIYGWTNGSEIEYSHARSYMSGMYYEKNTNTYKKVLENEKTQYTFSTNYNNSKWRTDQAIIGYLNSRIYWNTVGDHKYNYGGKTIITHKENF